MERNGTRLGWPVVAAAAIAVAGIAPAWAAPVQPAAILAHGAAHANTLPTQRSTEGYLGIGFQDVPDDEAASMHWKAPHGAEIVVVDHDGPAGKAGLRPRDIITALNGQVIDSSATLKRMLHEAGANVLIALDVLRGGQRMTLHARLANRDEVERSAQEHLLPPPPPPTDAPQGIVIQSFTVETYDDAAPVTETTPKSGKSSTFLSSMLHSGPFTGMDAEELGPQMRVFFGAGEGAGLLVNKVTPGSPAATAGLHAGDVLVRADGAPMRSVSDWAKHLKAAKGRAIALTVVRDKHEQTVTMTPDLKHRSGVTCDPPFCRSTMSWG